jgi:hypothetical protein
VTSEEIIIHQRDRQGVILRRNRVPDFSHGSPAIDKVHNLIGVELRKILGVEQRSRFAVQQTDSCHPFRPESRQKDVVVLVGEWAKLVAADGDRMGRRFG